MYSPKLKVEFNNYPGVIWEDWSEYLVKMGGLERRIESEEEGQAGVITYDNVSLEFYYKAGSVVYAAFSAELTSVQKYIIRISVLKSTGVYERIFEGVVDFATIEWSEYGGTISFMVLDKLSALSLTEESSNRIKGNVLHDVNPDTLCDQITFEKFISANDFSLRYTNYGGVVRQTTEENTPKLGDIIQVHFLFGQNGTETTVGLITFKHYDGDYINGKVYYGLVTDYRNWWGASTDEDNMGTCDAISRDNMLWWDKLFNGEDIYIKQYRTDYPITRYGFPGRETVYVHGYEIVSFDGIKIIKAIVKKTWGDIPIINRMGVESYPISLEYFPQLLNERPFEKHPLDALKMLSTTMRCYIYFDHAGNLVLQKKTLLSENILRTLNNGMVITQRRKYFWDKLIDAAEVKVKGLKGEGIILQGVAKVGKKPGIQTRNEMRVEIVAPPGVVMTEEGLNSYAMTVANELMAFYGRRHFCCKLRLQLSDDLLGWELNDLISINGVSYFISELSIDIIENVVEVEAVSLEGYDYDLGQVQIVAKENEYFARLMGSGDTTVYYTAINPDAQVPLFKDGDILRLLYTGNFKLTANKLDTVQDIGVGSVPGFVQVNLGSAGNAGQAVRGDRQLITSYPLSGGGNLTGDRTLGLMYNTANLKLTSNQLDTIQDIGLTSVPSFGQVNLGNAGNAGQAVRGDRQLITSYPLSGGGNLTGDRTLGLMYNTANLKLTSNQLDTIQDIGLTSVPTFGGLTVNGNVTQTTNAGISNSFISGWAGSGWRIDYGLTAMSKATLELDSLVVRGTMRVYELIINQVRSTNGSLFVTSSARVKLVEVESATVITIDFEDPEGNNICPFMENDLLLIQRVQLDGMSVVKKIYLQVSSVSGNSIEATILSGSVGNVESGDACVRIGNTTNTSRQGAVYLTSDDSNSPFIDITDGVNSVSGWTGYGKLKVRLGKLNGISDGFFGGLSGYGLYATNAYLKGKVYAETGGWIAGWDITETSLHSPEITETYKYKFLLNANNVSKLIGAHLYIDVDGIVKREYLSFGKILDGYGTPLTGRYGIAYRSGGDTFFELSNVERVIGGWNFTGDKLYKDSVSLESSGAMKGLRVGDDMVKIGSFVTASLTTGLNDINSVVLNGYSGIVAEDTGWEVDGSYYPYPSGSPIAPMKTQGTNLLELRGDSSTSWEYGVRHRLFEELQYVIGKNMRIEFKVKFHNGNEYNEHGGDFKVFVRYYKSTGWMLKYQEYIFSATVPDQLTPDTVFDKTGSNGIVLNLPYMEDVDRVYVYFYFSGGGETGSYYPRVMEVTDFKLRGYTDYKTQINGDGFEVYNSPTNYIRFRSGYGEVGIRNLKVNDKGIIRFHGRVSSLPTVNVVLGDMAILISTNKVYQVVNINVMGEPEWSVLN